MGRMSRKRERERGAEPPKGKEGEECFGLWRSRRTDAGLYEPCGFYLGLDPVSVGSYMGLKYSETPNLRPPMQADDPNCPMHL
jgi:hypothetical protein